MQTIHTIWYERNFTCEFTKASSFRIQVSDRIGYAPIVYADGYFYVIGGLSGSTTKEKTIGRLDATTMVWSKSGELVNGRHKHNAIYDGSSLIVVGGEGSYKTEKCVISNDQVSCTAQNPSLTNYSNYPELFLVPVDFCKTLP